MNKHMMRQMGFGDKVTLVDNGQCPFCHQPINMTAFRDDLSLREFKISGLCQACQDKTFGK